MMHLLFNLLGIKGLYLFRTTQILVQPTDITHTHSIPSAVCGAPPEDEQVMQHGPVLAGTRAQSGDRYGSGTLNFRQVFRGSLPLLSPAFRRSHFRRQMPPRHHQRERS
jgi:hypothetical protein